MLLDRQRVKFWQKWVFGLMALIMAAFLVMIPLGGNMGCGGSSATDQLDKDIVKYNAAVKVDPKNVAAWRALGENYLLRANQPDVDPAAQQADWRAAADSYEKAVKLLGKQKGKEKGKAARQQAAETLDQLVTVYLYLEDYGMATSTYGRITALRPKDSEAFFNMASVAIKANDTNAALLAFGKFLELEPDSPDAATVRAWIKDNTPKGTEQ